MGPKPESHEAGAEDRCVTTARVTALMQLPDVVADAMTVLSITHELRLL